MDSEISSRIIENSGKKLLMKVEKIGEIMKIVVSDGKSVWESSKSTIR